LQQDTILIHFNEETIPIFEELETRTLTTKVKKQLQLSDESFGKNLNVNSHALKIGLQTMTIGGLTISLAQSYLLNYLLAFL
jgi:hypothetical protein